MTTAMPRVAAPSQPGGSVDSAKYEPMPQPSRTGDQSGQRVRSATKLSSSAAPHVETARSNLCNHPVPAPLVQSTAIPAPGSHRRSEEHTSELQSLMRISYAVFCLKKKQQVVNNTT